MEISLYFSAHLRIKSNTMKKKTITSSLEQLLRSSVTEQKQGGVCSGHLLSFSVSVTGVDNQSQLCFTENDLPIQSDEKRDINAWSL